VDAYGSHANVICLPELYYIAKLVVIILSHIIIIIY
jgi:hypothetical protein